MKQNRLSSSEKMMLARLRAQIISARRWHHAEIQRLDALWSSFPSEVSRLSPQQRAIRLELARRTIAKFLSSVPASAFEPAPDPAAPPVTTEDAGELLAT